MPWQGDKYWKEICGCLVIESCNKDSFRETARFNKNLKKNMVITFGAERGELAGSHPGVYVIRCTKENDFSFAHNSLAPDESHTGFHISKEGDWTFFARDFSMKLRNEIEERKTLSYKIEDTYSIEAQNTSMKSVSFNFSGSNSTFDHVISCQGINAPDSNDYAEWFERYDKTENIQPGEIVSWVYGDKRNGVVKATKRECLKSQILTGVYSDTYGVIVGGKDNDSIEKKNILSYVPIGLNGRVWVKVNTDVKAGDYIVTSNEPGIGTVYRKKWYQFWKKKIPDPRITIGRALENLTYHNFDQNRVCILITK